MSRKLRLKRTISGITAAVMMVAAVPTTPAYAESGATSYSFDGYDVEYSVKNEWSDGKTIEVKITNTSDEPILNWAFKYDAEGKVNDLWNASVYSADNTSYIIKNDGWNYEIAPAASVLFGYKLTEFSDNNPTSFILCSKRVDKTDGYDVQYNITKEWDTGLQGEIVISNTSDEPLEAWELAFDSTFEINNLWDGRIISSEDGHYVIASEMWTNPIDIGSTKVIGFTGIKENTDEQSISNYNLSVVIIDSEATNSSTGGNGGNDEPEIDITTDIDGDKLPDVYEDMYGTDKENPDTDGDGLTDYEEITITGTDPLVYDSVTEGVSDEDADYDDDGLTTREEMTLGTDPTQADTDNDRINDYDEINVWHTDPLVADTDEDGIVDGDEVKIGLDPTNPETFGYPDIEYKSTQHIAEDSVSLSNINNEDNDIFTYSVDVTSNGYVEPYMYAKKSCYTSVMQNDFMIGIAPELVYLGEYGIDNIKVSFTVSDEYIDKTKAPEETNEEFLSKINIFRYFESANALLPVETTRDAETGTLSTESDAVTTYCLMNMDAWVNMLKECASESINDSENENGVPVSVQFNSSSSITSASSNSKATKINNSLKVIFVLQSAGNYENYFNREKITIDQLALMLYSNYSDVKIAILEYKENTHSNIKFFNYYNDFHTALQSISYTICKDKCERGLVFSQIEYCDEFQQTLNKFVMHFVNGRSYNMFIGGNHINDCGDNTNVSEFIPIGFYYNYESSIIATAINKHDGLNLYYDSIDTNQLYEHIQNHLKAPEAKFKALVPTGWKLIELNSPLVPDGSTDTDNDTLSDWDEVNHDLLKWDATGHVQQITIEDFYNEVDRLSLDRIYYQYPYLDVWFKGVTCIPLISNPVNPDSDGDGYADGNIDIYQNGKYNDPRPFYPDVIVSKIKNSDTWIKIENMISIPTGIAGLIGDYHYGSDQYWMKNSQITLNTVYELADGGCGTVASADVLSYLSMRDNINYVKNISGINVFGTGLNDKSSIGKNKYTDYLLYMGNNKFKPWMGIPKIISGGTGTWGILPFDYQKDFNNLNIGYSAFVLPTHIHKNMFLTAPLREVDDILNKYENHYYCNNLKELIKVSLNNDFPVTLLCSCSGIRCYYYDKYLFKEKDIKQWYHYVNVTELTEDQIAGKTLLTISTNGEKYQVLWEDLTNSSTEFLLGNMVIIYA